MTDHFILIYLPHSLFNLLEENLWNPTTQSVDRVQELGLNGVEQGLEHVVLEGKVTNCIIDHFEGWLLVVMIHSAVSVKDGHALLLGPFTVAPVHAVVRPVVPMAVEDEQTLWVVMKDDVEEVLVSPGDVVLVLLVEWM